MKNQLTTLFIIILISFAAIAKANTYYVSTIGNDSNPGTISAPFATWAKGLSVLKAGDILYIRGGTYQTPNIQSDYRVYMNNINGTSSNHIKIWAYPGERPVLDFGNITQGTNSTGFRIENCSWTDFKGLRVTNLVQQSNGNGLAGIAIWYSHDLTFELCETDHIGGAAFAGRTGCNNLTFINCDSHSNSDPYNTDPGGDADGFDIIDGAATYIGCRAWWNSDDGFDCFGDDEFVTYTGCWSFWNGYAPGTFNLLGNGNGFKWGLTNTDQRYTIQRRYENCLAFKNRTSGFDQNAATCGAEFYNCTSYQNPAAFTTGWGVTPQATMIVRNCVSYGDGIICTDPASQGDHNHNSWDLGLNVANSDFLSVNSTGMDGARQSDGSLPNLNFLKLAAGSKLIDAGINILGLLFIGNTADLGAFEYSTGSTPTNQLPVANAGADKNITLPTSNVTLTGSGTDADGTISSYQWSKVSGPTQFTIATATQVQTAVNSLVQGTYQFELKVTDNSGSIGRDTVKVIVNAVPNQAPSANAGTDKTIILPTNSVTVTGVGTDPDGTIAIYQWAKISGPSQFTIATPAQSQTLISGLVQGTYQFQLIVTDNLGATGKDTINVIVNAAPNQSPVANTGGDKTITLPTNTVTLTGSGTDADGPIASYQWSKVLGPSQFAIASSTQAQTVLNNLVQGVYQFELKVTDNLGATGKDTVIVTVNPAPPINQPPVANAGIDISVTLPVNTATLTGIGTDADGTIANYRWTMVGGPSQFTIASRNSQQTGISNLVQGVYQFELQVTDNLGSTDTDTVIVTVNMAPNQAPIANTGTDKIITLPTNTVTVAGSATDADGTIASYQWSKVSGPSQFAIATATQAQSAINNLLQGVYQFELKVTDNQGAIGRDTILVTVNAAPPPPSNQSPTANAGNDISITLPTNSTTLTGSGTDADGSITTYRWTKVAGPSQFTIASRNSQQTGISNLVQGVYQFELQVTDNLGATDTDTVIVTVNMAPNQAPIANTGGDKTITLPTNTVTVAGSATDADGSIASYQWSKVSGPSQFAIATATQAQSAINNLLQGVYQFELKVTDNQGAIGRDTILVTVNAAPPPPSNQSPTANAGNDISITLPTNSTTLTGSGTDADGSITTYRWTKVAGPSQFTIASRNSQQTGISNLVQGVYQFELQVTDNLGSTDTDTVIVTVNMAPNQAPIANTGTDKIITLPTNTVTVAGSATDADGSIASYQWSKVSGPSQFAIATATQAQSAINNLLQGVYQFELKVTDNQGAIGRDTILVTVNAAPPPPSNQSPIANAGNDISITLPTNNTTLTGSGTDADGSITTYRWTKVAGPSQFTIASRNSQQTGISNLVQGVYQFELQVTDNKGAIAKDTVTVTVNPGAAASNKKPSGNAGSDKKVTLPANSTTLLGSGSDPDGTITSYQWSQVSGPAQSSIAPAALTQTTISNLAEGVYQFEFKVTDDQGETAADTVMITVLAAPNQSPLANAGNNIMITLPINTTTLSGSGVDPDGTIVSYRWTMVGGPSQFGIASRSQAQTDIYNLTQGVYQFELAVTDDLGATGKDTVVVSVNAAPNQPPVANAGFDNNITLPVNTVNLVGIGADADGTITSYQWTKITGPTQFTIASPTQPQTVVNNLVQGTYQFELTVTDNRGGTAKDIVMVIVNPAPPPPNQAPVANAGSDKTITLPINTATLNGSGSDADGTIASYQWTKVSGPSQFTIISPAQAQTSINNLVEGVYQFVLTVTDNQGATGRDIVTVTVNPVPNQVPVANAGSDKMISLPLNSITVTGSGTDADGTIASYQWTEIAGHPQVTIATATQAQTMIADLIEGVYRFELRVTDNKGSIGRDTMQITVVKPASNISFAIYPNPVATTLNVKLDAISQPTPSGIHIFDSRGTLIYKEQFTRSPLPSYKQINLTKYPNGIYFIEIGDDYSRQRLKFVKQ